MQQNLLDIPPPEQFPHSHRVPPYVIVGDDVFPLGANIMKPYPSRDLSVEKTVHNYRQSRARRVSENAFGILSSRFQIYTKPIKASPESVNKIVKATVALHNYLRVKRQELPVDFVDREDTETNRVVPGRWRDYPAEGMENLNAVRQRPPRDGIACRNVFCEYFNNEGQVPWQNEMALHH